MCITLPMGFSHAVYIAQSAHEHIVYSSGALNREDSLLHAATPLLSAHRPLHGIVIDDFFLFCLSRAVAQRAVDRVLAAYRAAGFVVKQSKVVMPTSDPVKIIGFNINGTDGSIALPVESQCSLVRATLAVMQLPTVSGRMLSHIIGRWTWVMMLRRCTLAVLQHSYRYCRVAQLRPFTLWPSVRRELRMLLQLLPLMQCKLDTPFFHRAWASDASELAAGVVSTALTPELQRQLWPLCWSKRHALGQTLLNADRDRGVVDADHRITAADAASYDDMYTSVAAAPWRCDISSAWHHADHINPLELEAALLAVHRTVSYPSALSSRAFLMMDSSVALFSLWKGRSSSPSLLLILRKLSALLLACGLTLMLGWLPSAVNPADAPSRLFVDSDVRPMGRPDAQ